MIKSPRGLADSRLIDRVTLFPHRGTRSCQVSSVYEKGAEIGGGVQEISAILKRGFEAERAVVAAVAACKKPADAEFQVGTLPPILPCALVQPSLTPNHVRSLSGVLPLCCLFVLAGWLRGMCLPVGSRPKRCCVTRLTAALANSVAAR